jgi:adenylate cyclase
VGPLTGWSFEGWGRRAAWVVLILLLALEIFFGPVFDTPRLALFDLYQRALPRNRDAAPVVIVAVDEASLAAIGQWPWPRQIEAQLVSKILSGHPAALGIDLIWAEPDTQSPEQWLRQAGNLPAALVDSLRQLPRHDGLLAAALAADPLAIGVGGLSPAPAQKDSGSLTPVRQIGGAGLNVARQLQGFDAALRSIPELDQAAAGHGVLSVVPDPDDVFRRIPMLSVISGRLAPALDLEMLRLAAKASWIDLYLGDHAVQGIGVGPLRVPTQADASIWIHFSPHDERRFVSASDVLAEHIPADSFAQKLVLIAVTGLGQVDQRMTPLGIMPGPEIHAQLLENIIDGRLARRPDWASIVEPALMLVFSLFLIVSLPILRVRWQVPLSLLPLLLLAGLGFGLWRQSLLLVDVATPMMGLALVSFTLLGGNFVEADAQRRRLRGELQLRKIAAAKAEGELEAGRRIQMGILPNPATVANDRRFDLDALMIPARQIGGDLYDYFKIDADRLFFAIGDVSGKGVPAALFMAMGKSLCKSCALRGETDIGAIISRTNDEISRDNPEMLFITLFAGILNLASGELHFCNAGHDAPFLLCPGEAPDSIDVLAIDSVGGPPLCVVGGFCYEMEIFQLRPGDVLCAITDGVTEAMTADGVLLGRQRVRAMLAEVPAGASAKTVTQGLDAAVRGFTAGAEASDDLTILTIRWHGAI